MRICAEHWQMMRDAIDAQGLGSLVARSGEEAHANMVAELNGEPDDKNERFDPLMSMHWHFTNNALRAGGLYLMTPNPETGEPYCPICESEKHAVGFIAKPQIDRIAGEIAIWCRANGLIKVVK